jgi:acyl carrier protein
VADKAITGFRRFLTSYPWLVLHGINLLKVRVELALQNQFTPLNLVARIIAEVTDHTIQDRVLKVIATTKRIPLENVHPDSSFESLEIDSLDRLNILFGLESEFDIEINDEDAKHIQNIHEMIEGITQLVQAESPSSPSE